MSETNSSSRKPSEARLSGIQKRRRFWIPGLAVLARDDGRELALEMCTVGRRAQRVYIPEMRDSKFYKAMVGFDDGGMTHCDAVEYDDTIWLVPRWIDAPGGYRTPERMLRLDQFQHQMFPAPSPINIAVSEPIPHAIYSGDLTPALKDKYIVYERPDFRFKTAEAK